MVEKVRMVSSDEQIVDAGGVVTVKSGGRINEESGGGILGRESISLYHPDIGTAGSAYVVAPFDGTIIGLATVNQAANAGTKSVLTAKINDSAVTHPAWEVAVTAAAGTASSVTPSAANTFKAGDVLSVASDGGSSAVTPAIHTFTILRSS